MTQLLLKHATLMSFLMAEALSGQVERVEVAGSIRRGLESVNNIDLVLIPKPKTPFMLRDTMVRIADGQGVPERIIRFAGVTFRPVPIESTPFLFVLETVYTPNEQTPEGIRVQVAIASEDTWGSVMMFRTGSRDFNHYLAARAKGAGLVWSPFSCDPDSPEGLYNASTKLVVGSKTEQDIFKALKLQFVEPEKRERK